MFSKSSLLNVTVKKRTFFDDYVNRTLLLREIKQKRRLYVEKNITNSYVI